VSVDLSNGLMSETFRNSIFMGAHREHLYCAGGSELRSAAPAIQGGGHGNQNAACLYSDLILQRRTVLVMR
jgi:hypothetical protein